MAMVPSMVAISCMPAIAMTAAKNRRDGCQVGGLLVVEDTAVFAGRTGGI
jgi:hypothetical protein